MAGWSGDWPRNCASAATRPQRDRSGRTDRNADVSDAVSTPRSSQTAIFRMAMATPCGRITRRKAEACPGRRRGRWKPTSRSRRGSKADCPGPRKRSLSGSRQSPCKLATSAWASRANRAIVPSAAGRACATLPPRVAVLRTCGPPISPAASNNAWACWRTSGEATTWLSGKRGADKQASPAAAPSGTFPGFG